MNSQRIKNLFGSYAVDVLSQSREQRIASLASLHDAGSVCRTLAVTNFVLPVDAALIDADTAIRAGASIGETFMKSGIPTRKVSDYWCHAKAGEHFSQLTLGSVPPETTLAIRVYRLQAAAAGNWIDYAVIAEAYHPAHIGLSMPDESRRHAPDAIALSALEGLRTALITQPG